MNTNYKLTFLSPIHIGSGEKYFKEYDYYCPDSDTGTFLIDHKKFLDDLQYATAERINKFTNNPNIIDFMNEYKINPKKYCKKISHQKVTTNEIGQFIRDGFDVPYIPGSSLKGALRTVIAQHLFKEEKTNFQVHGDKKTLDYAELGNAIFGKDSNHDFLRGLLVRDTIFKPSDLNLRCIKVYTMNKEKKLALKMKNSKNRTEMKLYYQFLKMEATSLVKIKVDGFIFNRSIIENESSTGVWEKLCITPSQRESLLNLRDIANKYAKRQIEKEIVFFSDQEALEPVLLFYRSLLKTINAMIDNKEKAFLLNIGWGTGWHFKTGDYMTEKELDGVRYEFDMGNSEKKCPNNHPEKEMKYNSQKKNYFCYQCRKEYTQQTVTRLIKPFPKSRKILFDGKNNPVSVPGWIKLTEI